MKRLLIPLAALLIGAILGWGASALASEGRQAYKPCIGEPYGTCQTMSRWCYYLKTQTHWRNIEDVEVREMVHYFRIVCRSWGN